MKAILFDLDGTLIDSSEGITKSAQYALSHFGIDERTETVCFLYRTAAHKHIYGALRIY